MNEIIELLRDIDLFSGFSFDFAFQLANSLKLMLELMPHLDIFSLL